LTDEPLMSYASGVDSKKHKNNTSGSELLAMRVPTDPHRCQS